MNEDQKMYDHMPHEIRRLVALGEQCSLFGGSSCLIPVSVSVDATKLRKRIYKEIGRNHLAPGFSIRPACGCSLCVRISHMEVYQERQVERKPSRVADDKQTAFDS